MSTHHRYVCAHGELISQCRCASPNKVTFIGYCKGNHDNLPVLFAGKPGDTAVLLPPAPEKQNNDSDRESLVNLIKRISPIKSEPLATAVAEEWAEEFIKEGWHR